MDQIFMANSGFAILADATRTIHAKDTHSNRAQRSLLRWSRYSLLYIARVMLLNKTNKSGSAMTSKDIAADSCRTECMSLAGPHDRTKHAATLDIFTAP
jgi:hypothetical protein